MPAAVALRQRQELVERREKGESFVSIAHDLKISYETVRSIYHRFAQTGQLAPAYDKCCHTAIRKDKAIYSQAVALKQAHPTWGAGLIWVELAEVFAEEDLPSERTLQRWFKRAGVQRPPPDRRARPFVTRGKYAHEVWAIDAKEQIELADGAFVSWFTVTDEGRGAVLGVALFPHQTLDTDQSASSQIRTARADAVLGLPAENTHG